MNMDNRVLTQVPEIEFQLPQPFIFLPNACVFGKWASMLEPVLGVGSIDGEILLYHNDKLWKQCDGLGHITCMKLTKIWSCDKENILLVTNAEGECFVFVDTLDQPTCTFTVPYNISVITFRRHEADFRVIFGTRDRRVHLFSATTTCNEERSLTSLSQCDFPQEIESIVVAEKNSLYVGLPDGKIVKAETDWQSFKRFVVEKVARTQCPIYLLGDIKSPYYQNQSLQLVASVDGVVDLINRETQKQLWSIDLQRMIRAIGKIDLYQNGHDHLLLLTWSGQIRLIDTKGQQVTFAIPGRAYGCCISGSSFAVFGEVGQVFVFRDMGTEIGPIQLPDVTQLVEAKIKARGMTRETIEGFIQRNESFCSNLSVNLSIYAKFIYLCSNVPPEQLNL